ncbi:hypothetical protein I4U23_026016 [Adineta vaga]|nr:hypothetical protein I4U23_026016 [Adineta vaga]
MYSSDESLKLYVGDLGDNRRSDLSRLFSKYGEISQIYLDERKHFAFVEFTSLNDAQRALKQTNNRIVNGSKLRVEYAKSSRHDQRVLSRELSPRTVLYNHLQVTANRLPRMQVFHQSYPQHNIPNLMENPPITPRGRSITPPSLKYKSSLLSRSRNLHHQHQSSMYGDPYVVQRLPPSAFQSSCVYRQRGNPSEVQHYRRSRSRNRRRTPSPHEVASSREHKRKRQSSSPSPHIQRGPRTPPPVFKSSTYRSRKRSRSGSKTIASSSESEQDRSNSKKSSKENSTRKHSHKEI